MSGISEICSVLRFKFEGLLRFNQCLDQMGKTINKDTVRYPKDLSGSIWQFYMKYFARYVDDPLEDELRKYILFLIRY